MEAGQVSDQPALGADVTHLMAPIDPHQPHMAAAPTGNEPVTLGDLKDDPIGSMQRIGHILKQDASDPKLWLSMAASYFGPKVIRAAAPLVVRGIGTLSRGAQAVGGVVEPGDIGIVSPRLGKAVDLAQRVRGAMRGPEAPSATSPAESVPGGTAPPTDPLPSPVPAAAQTAAHPTRTTGQMSPTAIRSDLGMAARRLKVSLPPESPQALQAETLVRQGQSIEDAVRAVTAPAASPETPSTPKLTADEFRGATAEYQRLRRAGKTDAEAQDVIAAALEMQKKLGLKTPTDAQTKFPKGLRGKAPSPKE